MASGLVAAVSLICASRSTGQDLILKVELKNEAAVDKETLRAAFDIVSQVYANVGVETRWVDADAIFTIILRRWVSKEIARRRPDALGYTPGTEDRTRRRLALILVPRVDDIASGYAVPRSVVMGTSIAHELGHLLLFNEHSATGIMQPYFRQTDFRKARNGRLLFTTEQSGRLRNRLRELTANH